MGTGSYSDRRYSDKCYSDKRYSDSSYSDRHYSDKRYVVPTTAGVLECHENMPLPATNRTLQGRRFISKYCLPNFGEGGNG